MARLLCLARESLAILSQWSLLSFGDSPRPWQGCSPSSLQPLVAAAAGPCLGDALLGWSPVESILRLVPPVLRTGASSSWVKLFHTSVVRCSTWSSQAWLLASPRGDDRGVRSPPRHPSRGCWYLHLEGVSQGSPNSPCVSGLG